VIVPLLHAKVYVPAGVTVRSTAPSGLRHDWLGIGTATNVKFELKLVTVKVSALIQPLELVTVTEYIPAERLSTSSVTLAFDQENVFPESGRMERSMAPFGLPQEEGVTWPEISGVESRSSIVNEAMEEQLLTSETVTPKMPADRFDRSSVDAPEVHKKVYDPAGVTVTSILPLGERQEEFGRTIPLNVKAEFVLMISNDAVPVQPSVEVTVTL
jgi:hypothetical protein